MHGAPAPWLSAVLCRAQLCTVCLPGCLPACPPGWLQEVALIGMTAYLSYLAGDVLGLSGILALFVCAVAISHYALHNISGE